MDQSSHNITASLQQGVLLYRKLLSLIKTPQSEADLIHFIIDSIYELYPNYRASFSNVGADGQVFFHYSRQPVAKMALTGSTMDITRMPEILHTLLRQEIVSVSDIRNDPRYSPIVANIIASLGSVAQLLIPFEEEKGKVSMISLVHTEPTEWSESTIALLTEVAGLVRVMMREARTQAKLQKTETIFRQFAENVDVVFWLSDTLKREILYVSPAYEKTWGRTMESLYDDPRSFLEAVHPEDRDRVYEAVSMQAQRSYEQIYRVVKPDGEIRWVRDRGFQVRDSNNQVQRIAGFAEDITELREAQERLESTQVQVVSNAKFAALGEMASGIAHEINNPLAVIHGIAVQLQEILGKTAGTRPMVLENLESVEKMANRIAGIVKGLRTFSRQTDGDPMLPADLSVIVRETAALFEARLRAAGLHLNISVPEGPVGIRCRSSEVSQVIVNLVNNAVDAVEGSTNPRIGLRVTNKFGLVKLEVENNGPGVPPLLRERIFQPFFTTKEVGKGTGLGLSISKGIAESHGGRLFLDSSSKSTRFVLELSSEQI